MANKTDLPPAWDVADVGGAARGVGADRARASTSCAARCVGRDGDGEPARDRAGDHERAARRALERRTRGARSARARRPARGTPEEFVLADLHEARGALEEITGARTPDDVLQAIFAKFCIGK